MRNVFYDKPSPSPKHEFERVANDTIILKVSDHDVLIDADDLDSVIGKKWHVTKAGYVSFNKRLPCGKSISVLMHRFLLGIEYGDRRHVDHANRNRADNRKSNLRLASRTQNSVNRVPPRFVSPYRGVVRQTSKIRPWESRIKWRGRQLYLGSFATAEEAAREYDLIARKLYGEFAVLNFSDAVMPEDNVVV